MNNSKLEDSVGGQPYPIPNKDVNISWEPSDSIEYA